MPDEPETRSSPRPAVWAAQLAVLGLVATVAVSAGILGAFGGSSTRTPSRVVTAPASSVAAGGTSERLLAPELRPVSVGAGCASRGRVLRVLQLNIHFGISRGGGLDLPDLADEVVGVRPDLVSLNEVDSHTSRSRRIDEAAYLAEATGLHAVYGPTLPWEGGLFGNAILSRYPVVASRNLRLPGVPGLEQRGLLTAAVQVGARTVSFSSMHWSDGPDGRTSRTLQSWAVARVLRHASTPSIVAGDLNATPYERPVRVLRQYLLDAQEQGGIGPGDTVPETAPHSRIDYVLYDRHFGVVPRSTRVLPSSSSDHRSVFTELSLLPRRCGG